MEQEKLEVLLGGGLIEKDNGAEWARSRKLCMYTQSHSLPPNTLTTPNTSRLTLDITYAVTPAFHRKRLKELIPLFAERTKLLIDRLEQCNGKREVVDMQREFQKLTFDVIGLVCLDFDFRSQMQDISQFEQAWHVIAEHLNFRFFFPIPYWRVWKTKAVRLFDDSMKLLDDTIYEAIDTTLKKTQQQQEGGEKEEEGEVEGRSILHFMLREKRKSEEAMQWLTSRQIRNELITLLFAGHDTTTNLYVYLNSFFSLFKLLSLPAHKLRLTWALYYVSTNPGILLSRPPPPIAHKITNQSKQMWKRR